MESRDAYPGEDLLRGSTADYEKHIIVSALERTGGNQSRAARQLGTTRRILAYRIRKYGIDPGRFCRAATPKRPLP
jgi:Nif-specific regulatory protein